MAGKHKGQDELARYIREFNIADYYKKIVQGFDAMARPGVEFTPEQMAQIKELAQRYKPADTQGYTFDIPDDLIDDH